MELEETLVPDTLTERNQLARTVFSVTEKCKENWNANIRKPVSYIGEKKENLENSSLRHDWKRIFSYLLEARVYCILWLYSFCFCKYGVSFKFQKKRKETIAIPLLSLWVYSIEYGDELVVLLSDDVVLNHFQKASLFSHSMPWFFSQLMLFLYLKNSLGWFTIIISLKSKMM